MQLVKAQTAATFSITNSILSTKAIAHHERQQAWESQQKRGFSALHKVVLDNAKVKPLGIVSRDSMTMGVFGVVFPVGSNPGPAFIKATEPVAKSIQRQGVRGEAFLANIESEGGRKIMRAFNDYARISASRPLLAGVDGLRSAVIEGDRLVLTSTAQNAEGIVIKAGRSAVAPGFGLELVSQKRGADAANEFIDHVAQARDQRIDSKVVAAGRPSMKH